MSCARNTCYTWTTLWLVSMKGNFFYKLYALYYRFTTPYHHRNRIFVMSISFAFRVLCRLVSFCASDVGIEKSDNPIDTIITRFKTVNGFIPSTRISHNRTQPGVSPFANIHCISLDVLCYNSVMSLWQFWQFWPFLHIHIIYSTRSTQSDITDSI